MNIILTGANGFVGKNLNEYFGNEGVEVLPLGLRNGMPNQLDAYQQADALVHLAGIAHDLKGNTASAQYQEVNVALTKALMDWFITSNVKDFIFISSVKAIADTSETLICESTPAHPNTTYGVSKYQAESYLKSVSLPAGKRLFVLQPTLIYGPGLKGNLANLAQWVVKGLPFPFASFHEKRSYLNVNNLGFTIKTLVKNTHLPSNTFIVSDDEQYSSTDWVKLLAKAMNKNAMLIPVPQWLWKGLARIGSALKLAFNEDVLSKITAPYIVSNSKLKRILGIPKMPFNASSHLKELVESLPKKM